MSDPPRGPVHRLLHDDHEHLEALFSEIVDAAEAGVDARTLGEIWDRFEGALRRHLAAEEDLVFPQLEARHPDAIRDLRAEHDWIRTRLDDLGLEVDLHLVRSHEVRELVDRLRRHAASEDATLYLWAESELGVRRPGLLKRLIDRLASPVRGGPRTAGAREGR